MIVMYLAVLERFRTDGRTDGVSDVYSQSVGVVMCLKMTLPTYVCVKLTVILCI